MSTALQRGIVLYSQNRHDLADREFRRALAESPDDAQAHAFLALCLSRRDRDADALAEADEAVRLEPDAAFSHFVRGQILLGLRRPEAAESSAREAIRLDPADADYRVLLGHAALARRRANDALEAADAALALDAQHLGARNLRALALTQLGRKAEAAETLGEALAEDPEDAFSHANQGWVCLHRGDHGRALEHFREALRLDPTMEWARVGIIEALKARHLVYRLMLRFFLWMGRQGRAAQVLVVLGFVFGRQLLGEVARKAPAFAPIIRPILILSFAFLILTWIASPLFNFLLRFNRFGRLALSREERVESSWIGGCTLLAVAGGVSYAAAGWEPGLLAMAVFGLLLFPLSMTFKARDRSSRLLFAAGTLGLLLLTVPLAGWLALGASSPFGDEDLAIRCFTYYLYGSIGSTWLPMIAPSRMARG